MAIKLLGIDIDGTLVNSSFQISRENFEAIQQARAAGVVVALLTGRRFRAAAPLAIELGLTDPIVVNNGALIKRPDTGALLQAVLLPYLVCHEVVCVARELDMDPVVTIDAEGHGLMLLDRLDETNESMARYLRISSQDVKRVEDLLVFVQTDPIQVTFSHRPARVDTLKQTLERRLAPRIKLLNTVYPKRGLSILDVIHPHVSKGTGLAALAKMYGLAREEVMAIGDNFNDLEMLQFAGAAVVMGNAEEELRALGFPVTATNDEHGVARAIEQYILERPIREEGA